jgi:hypothetical protein
MMPNVLIILLVAILPTLFGPFSNDRIRSNSIQADRLQITGTPDPYPNLPEQMGEAEPYPLPENQGETTGTTSELQEVNAYPPIETPLAPQIPDFTYKSYLPLVIKTLYYDRASAVSYADAYAHSRHPCFPSYGTGSDCTDCTNYLSQVLYYGKLPIIGGLPDDTRSWWVWCNDWCSCDTSESWRLTKQMSEHALQLSGVRYSQQWTVDYLEAGDFMLMDLYTSPYHGEPNHARVIVGYGYPQEGDMLTTEALLANQHCTDRYRVRWDYHITGADLLWYWHVLDHPVQ